jgi:hypothetical protein
MQPDPAQEPPPSGDTMNSHPFRRIATLLLLPAMLAISGPLAAQTKPARTDVGADSGSSILWVGNSFFYYNNSMHSHVLGMQRAADPANQGAYRATSVTISGSGIDWHDVESYFRPKAIGNYSFDANNNVVFNKLDKLFDAAIMMDCSQCPIHSELKTVFTEYAKKDAEIVRARGTRPIFFMSWAYADKPEMTAQLAEAYTIAGNANNALVIPAGLAFARSVSKQPELNLYVADKRHPSLAGTYLAACVVFSALTGKSPVGNSYLAGIDAPTAKLLQETAWATVQDYYGK